MATDNGLSFLGETSVSACPSAFHGCPNPVARAEALDGGQWYEFRLDDFPVPTGLGGLFAYWQVTDPANRIVPTIHWMTPPPVRTGSERD